MIYFGRIYQVRLAFIFGVIVMFISQSGQGRATLGNRTSGRFDSFHVGGDPLRVGFVCAALAAAVSVRCVACALARPTTRIVETVCSCFLHTLYVEVAVDPRHANWNGDPCCATAYQVCHSMLSLVCRQRRLPRRVHVGVLTHTCVQSPPTLSRYRRTQTYL